MEQERARQNAHDNATPQSHNQENMNTKLRIHSANITQHNYSELPTITLFYV